MKCLLYSLVLGVSIAVFATLSAGVVTAQEGPPPDGAGGPGGPGDPGGPGGPGEGRQPSFDPAQMQQMMLQRMQQELGASDEEWKVIAPRLQKVMELQRAARFGGMRGPGGGPAGPGAPGNPKGPGNSNGPVGPRMPGAGSAEAEALQKALESKDSTKEQILGPLKELRSARGKRDQELQKAQQDLREVLSVRQEARLVLMRLLD